MGDFAKNYRELHVYRDAFELAMEIFELTKKFPAEEKFEMTDQLRRSSRSVCRNIGESWRKRRYNAAFIAKLSDSETEACETQVSLEFFYRCSYITEQAYLKLYDRYDKVISQIVL